MYIENSLKFTKKLLRLMRQFSKVTGYKVNIQNHSMSVCYHIGNIGKVNLKIKFTIALKIMR